MSWKSLPPSTPGALLRHPILLTEWLRLTNGLRRRAGSSVLIVVGVISTALVTGLGVFSSQLAAAIAVLAEYWVLTAAVAALYAAASTAKRRRHGHDSHLQSWLIATPMPPSSVRFSNAIRSIAPMLAQFFAVAAFILAARALCAGIGVAAGVTIGAIGGGMVAGGLVGWLADVKRSGHRWEGSRYVPRTRTNVVLRPASEALAHWPIVQVLAWSRPENSRYLLVAALLAVQGGSSAMSGLSVVAIYFLGGYLAGLLSAVLQAAKSAAQWLRATPVTLGAFVWMLSRRVLLHQVSGTALAGTLMWVLGSPPSTALQAAALWLGLVISIAGVALVDSYRGRSPTVKIALSVATLVALAAAWQLRPGAKA